ncbi:MAG: hypothetical protein IJH77_01550 [Mogibacterium sp.]|nr:hypothetical protein [Mogibacterium sp.]
MGELIKYECKECGYSFRASLGVGFNYPTAFQNAVYAAQDGKFGKTYKRWAFWRPPIAIDTSGVIARCEDCGRYAGVTDMTLYKMPDRFLRPQKRVWTGSQEERFITPDEMEKYGKVAAEWDHRCGSCNGRLRIIKKIPENLVCPDCGRPLVRESEALWD